jgi:hypothetical protein
VPRHQNLPDERRRRFHLSCYVEQPLVDALEDIRSTTFETRSDVLRRALVGLVRCNEGGRQ